MNDTSNEIAAGSFDDLAEGGVTRVTLGDGTPVAVFKIDGELHAIGDTCSHELASLSEGDVDPDECTVECPKHGATFDIRTGKNLTFPATKPVPAFTVTVRDGIIYVETR